MSDGYAVYQKWVNQRQTWLAHLIRRARGLSERENPSDARCGEWGMKELQRLCKMGKDPPTVGEFRTSFARICRLIDLYGEADKVRRGKVCPGIWEERGLAFRWFHFFFPLRGRGIRRPSGNKLTGLNRDSLAVFWEVNFLGRKKPASPRAPKGAKERGWPRPLGFGKRLITFRGSPVHYPWAGV